ncbi:MAG: ATP-dependent Clp protease proteolytic subunit [Candidatus Paceibacterota bacterium]
MQKGLLEKNILEITDEKINAETFYHVCESVFALIAKGSPDIEIIITSGGGSVEPGLAIYDLLRLYKGKKTGIVVGYAHSMAAIILQACEVRKACKHAELLIHNIRRNDVSLDVLRDSEKLSKLREEMEKDQKKHYEILSERTGRSIEEICRKCEEEIKLDANEAKEFGLIDEII